MCAWWCRAVIGRLHLNGGLALLAIDEPPLTGAIARLGAVGGSDQKLGLDVIVDQGHMQAGDIALAAFQIGALRVDHPGAITWLGVGIEVEYRAEALVADRDGFVRNAVGAWLRSLSIHDPDRARAFLDGPGRGLKAFARKDAARRHGLWVVGGSIPLAADDPGKVRNSTLVFDDTGHRVARYDKVHLFGFETSRERYDESATIEAGNEVVCFEGPCGEVGLSICYDLRFPELYRRLAGGVGGNDKPVDLIVMPAAFTETTGRAHWEILLRARAIENQCYVLAIGQGGVHENRRETHGNSMLIDPWGDIVARRDKGAGVVVGELDHARIAEVRTSLPALTHRVL